MKRNGKPALIQSVVIFLIILFTSAVGYGGSLQEEVDKLCVQTQEAESLSLERLQELATECDQLLKTIEESNDEKKKLLVFRLKKCSNFFAYIIELKKGTNSSSQQ